MKKLFDPDDSLTRMLVEYHDGNSGQRKKTQNFINN
jgi:hypothetical protein